MDWKLLSTRGADLQAPHRCDRPIVGRFAPRRLENPGAKCEPEHLPRDAPFELMRHDETLALYVEAYGTFNSTSAALPPGATGALFDALLAS